MKVQPSRLVLLIYCIVICVINLCNGQATMRWENVTLLGQLDYNTNIPGCSASLMTRPNSVAIVGDSLAVSEPGCNRTLIFKGIRNLANGNSSADYCLDCDNLHSFGSFAQEGVSGYCENNVSAYLWVADNTEKSFKRYPADSFSFNQSYDQKITYSFSQPSQVTVDVHNQILYTADTYYNRVLVFHLNNLTRPFGVYGPVGFSTPSSSTLQQPTKVLLGCKDDIWIVDSYNNRILHYSNGSHLADIVLGQNDTSSTNNNTLYRPGGAVIDSSCTKIWIADSMHNRIVSYKLRNQSQNFPDEVLGVQGVAVDQFNYPNDLALDEGKSIMIIFLVFFENFD